MTAPTPWAVTSAEVPLSPASSTIWAIAGTSAMNGAARNVLTNMYPITTRSPGSRRT